MPNSWYEKPALPGEEPTSLFVPPFGVTTWAQMQGVGVELTEEEQEQLIREHPELDLSNPPKAAGHAFLIVVCVILAGIIYGLSANILDWLIYG